MQKRIHNTLKVFIVIIFAVSFFACKKEKYYPKPTAYFRIDLPEKEYKELPDTFDFTFNYPTYGKIIPYSGMNNEATWFNISFPAYKATLHFSYEESKEEIENLYEDARSLVYKHTIKADAIKEKTFFDDKKKVYGILYDISGNAASSVQFFLTDSTSKFIRGALYFNAKPNKDSLDPVIDFFREDIIHMVETFEWK